MKRIILFVTGLVAAAILLCGCSGEKNITITEQSQRAEATGETWTIMVYMSGGQDEYNYGTASKAIEQMTKVEYPSNINVLLETGGSYKWKLGGIDTNYLDRFEVNHKGIRLMERTELDSMGKTDTLKNFLEWGKENYKAQHYALIVYGAGGGVAYGDAYDEIASCDRLNIQRMATAIGDADMNFDIIGFDTPLAASLENASILSTHTDYLIASQETMAQGGWNYKDWFKYIIDNPTSSVLNTAKAVCDTYMKQCRFRLDDKMATMSVIDMSKVSTLVQSFDGMADELCTALDNSEDRAYIQKASAQTLCFGANTEDEGYSNMLDLAAFAHSMDSLSGNTLDHVLADVQSSVVYKVSGDYRKDSCGISVYYPINEDATELQNYVNYASGKSYKKLLTSLCVNTGVESDEKSNSQNRKEIKSSFENSKENLTYTTVSGTTGFELNMTGDVSIIKNVKQRVFTKGIAGTYLYLGDARSIDENKEAGIFKTNNDFELPKLNGHIIQLNKVCEGDGYTIYSTPIKIDGTQTNLRIIRTEKNGKSIYKPMGLFAPLGNGNQTSRVKVKIKIYNKVTTMMRDYESGQLVSNEGFKTWPFGTRITCKGIEDGYYRTDYKADYTLGGSLISGTGDFSVSEGKIKYQ